MDIRFYKKIKPVFLLFASILFSQISLGQISEFSLALTSENESCTANGLLSYTVSNTTTGATLIYRIYKLPDVTTPIAVTNANTFGGLTAGSYMVVAIQTLGDLSNTQEQTAQILNFIIPIAFQITSQPPLYCGTEGTITVNVDQGNPVGYEIIRGPVIVPLQISNVFNGLPQGEYDIRVIDNCGDGVVQTHYLSPPFPNLTVSVNQACELLDCDTKSVSININALINTTIGYPLQVELSISPPGQPPAIFNQTIVDGNPSSQSVTFAIPYYNIYYVANFIVTDACGNSVSNNFELMVEPAIEITPQKLNSCFQEINISLCNLLPPYTVEFLSSPTGFIPANFNVNNLGPFSTIPIIYATTPANELPAGYYDIKVTDACGTSVQNQIKIVKTFTDYTLVPQYSGCAVITKIWIPYQGIPPATVILIGAPIDYDFSLPRDVSANIDPLSGFFNMELVLPGTYVFTGVNICGQTYILNVVVDLLPPNPNFAAIGDILAGCDVVLGNVTVSLSAAPAISTVVMTQAPAVFTQPLPYNVSSYLVSPSECVITGLPVGQYTFIITDICGTVYPPVDAEIKLSKIPVPPLISFLRGCAIGKGSIKLQSGNGQLLQVIITSAPTSYSQILPYDVSFNIDPSGVFYMNTLPEGNYVFQINDACGIQNILVQLPGYDIYQNAVNVIGNCGSFNLYVSHVVGKPIVHGLWLQKRNPVTGQWGHPLTDSPYTPGAIPTEVDSYWLVNKTINYNIASFGTFRVLKYNIYYSNGSAQFENCFSVLKEFTFTAELRIASATATPCNSGSSDVLIIASGIGPFTYKITSKDGLPFYIDNGSMNIFTGIAPGIYNFQLTDGCGNIVNRLLDITTLLEPTIQSDNLCEGRIGQLSVPAISFLNYRWWKAPDTTLILSTSNVLNLNPFSNVTSPGTYYVRIYSTSDLSCIDLTLSYVVPMIAPANAGQDGIMTICGSSDAIDLFSILGAPYDSGGVWDEISSSGTLSESTWSPAGILYGTYIFKYSASNICGINDEAFVTIYFNSAPDFPVITARPDFCENTSIYLNVNSISEATYQWSGPNGFASAEQNPTIENSCALNNGMYAVTATVHGCASTATMLLTLQAKPEFTIVPSCINNVYTLSILPNQNSFEDENVSYSWTGPNAFTSTRNAIQITGLEHGVYEVTVTNMAGCFTTNSISVAETICTVPNVITPDNDNNNDYFDLTGLNVNRIEIYSRWGRLVYEKNYYTNQWYGQNMNGKELPDSTYYYILYFNSGPEKNGWIFKTTKH